MPTFPRPYLSENLVMPLPTDIVCPSCCGVATVYLDSRHMPIIYCRKCGLQSFISLFDKDDQRRWFERPFLPSRPIEDSDLPAFTVWLKRYFDPLLSTADAPTLLRQIFCRIERRWKRFACPVYHCEGLVTGYVSLSNRSFYLRRNYDNSTGGILPRAEVFRSNRAIFISPIDALRCYVINARQKGSIDIPIYAVIQRELKIKYRWHDPPSPLLPLLNINRKCEMIFAIPAGSADKTINRIVRAANVLNAFVSAYDPEEFDDVDSLIATIERRAQPASNAYFLISNRKFFLQKDKLVTADLSEYDGVLLLGGGLYVIKRENCILDATKLEPITNFGFKVVGCTSKRLLVDVTYIDGTKLRISVSLELLRISAQMLRKAIIRALNAAGKVPFIRCSSNLLMYILLTTANPEVNLASYVRHMVR